MKKSLIAFSIALLSIYACSTQQTSIAKNSNATASKNDTIRIANDSLEYEVIIIDAGFNTWLNTQAQPRTFYSKSYLQARNIPWVTEWNIRVRQPLKYGSLYQFEIDYQPNIDYGYEVNYLLFNYLTYFQLQNNQRLGAQVPRP